MNKTTILIGHPYWGRGGAEIATMWLIVALKSNYRIHLITRGGWNLKELNHISGTEIEESDITLLQLPFQKLLQQTIGGHLWHGMYLRYCRQISANYDICISAARPIDWGKKAIHILADVSWNETLQQKYSPQEKNNIKGIRSFLFKVGNLIAGKSKRGIKNDIYIANSKWTANVSIPYCIQKPIVIYPPVTGKFIQKDWEHKKEGFVYLGRIAKEKRIEMAIDILTKVREKGFDISFHILGRFENDDYSKEILTICKQNDNWITLHGGVFGDKKYQILANYKYGINARKEEPFGISTAEMVKSGMLPFLTHEGGQKEIVPINELQFSTTDEAVKKISLILESKEKQQSILSELKQQSPDFSTERFCEEVREFVNEHIHDFR